jgi:biopolymer transport protein ExbD
MNSLASLSLTPLIDVVFLLLIFFLVATRFAEEERELDVQLPSASTARPMTAPPQVLFVNVDSKGEMLVERRKVDLLELEDVLRRYAEDHPTGRSVKIRGDERSPLGTSIAIINLCKKVGIRECDFPVRNEAAPEKSP